ncbi:hypothetical protein [Burkholderia vietnamiensis]|uniref:hypothetical protein n=1 Tax=Burkholderia vietnamiensis TaxID=60552 RepID=UPI001BA32EBF|nr:hypothetical protein [Burkholderia vietnamiensis]MBR7999859.1 hypothetical protein [Burkholderia vietnamiensis]
MKKSSTRLLIATIVFPLLIYGCVPNGTSNGIAKAVVGTALQAVGIDAVGTSFLIGTMDNVNRSVYTDHALNAAAMARASTASDAIVPRKGRATEAQVKQLFPDASIPTNSNTFDPAPMKGTAE